MTGAELAALAREAWATTPPPPRHGDTDHDREARRRQLRHGWADTTTDPRKER